MEIDAKIMEKYADDFKSGYFWKIHGNTVYALKDLLYDTPIWVWENFEYKDNPSLEIYRYKYVFNKNDDIYRKLYNRLYNIMKNVDDFLFYLAWDEDKFNWNKFNHILPHYFNDYKKIWGSGYLKWKIKNGGQNEI